MKTNSIFNAVCKTRYLALLVVLIFTCGNAWGAPVTIASWTGAARTANSQVSPTSSQTDNSSARLKSECALSTAGSGGCAGSYYSTWTNGNCIYLTSLSLSGYTDVSLDISLRRRNGTCTAAFYASTDGSSYAGSAFDTETLTNSCDNYSVDVASNVKAIKIVIDGGSGNLWLGDVSLSGTAAAATPTVTPDPTSLSWGTVLQGSSQSTKTISITGANLTAGTLTISATGGYSVTPTSKSVSGTLSATTLTVTPPSTSTTGAKNGKVTINGGGLASAVEVNLSMTVNAASTVTWMNNGSEYTTTLVANGSKPTFPSNPSSCSDVSTTFYGWSTAAWSGTVDALGGKTVYTAASSMPNVSAAVTYYATFAKATTGSETSVTGGTFSDAVTTQTGWTGSGVGTYSGNGVKFDGANDYIQSPDISSNSLKEVTVKYKAGHNGGAGSVLTFASLDASGNVIDSKTATPSQAYNSQTTTYSLTLSGATVIKYVRVTMTSKTNNLGMKYCQIYYTPVTYSKYLTNCCTELGTINGSVNRTYGLQDIQSCKSVPYCVSAIIAKCLHFAMRHD